MEPKAAIQESLLRYNREELCTDCIRCKVVPHWTRGKHILALVSSGASIEAEQGLFLYKYSEEPLSSIDQLVIETVLAIKGDFRYSMSPISPRDASSQVQVHRVTMCTSAVKLEVDLTYDKKASHFFSNVKECISANFEKIKRGISPNFGWITPYQSEMQPSNQLTGKTTDAFGMISFNDDPQRHRKTVASSHIAPHRPAPKPPQPRSHSVHNPGAPQRDFFNMTAIATLDDTYSTVTDTHYTTMKSDNRLSASDANVESNPYANLAASPPKKTLAQQDFSEYIHPTPPKPRQATTSHPLVQSSSSSSSSTSSSSSSDEDRPEKGKDAMNLDEKYFTSNSHPPKGPPPRPPKPPGNSKFYVDQSIDDTPGDEYSEVTAYTGIVTPIGIREGVMKRREREYTYLEPFRLFIGTWNVNGQNATEDLTNWLYCDASAPAMYAIGFQELDLSKEAFLFNDSVREEEWRLTVEKALHQDGKYKLVRLVRLVGMMLLVYVREGHQRFVEDVMSETVGTGIMGKMGNKGGVGVRLKFHNTTFCFINCHLAAHIDEYERRNQDYNDICQRLYFDKGDGTHSIRSHDLVIWMGDLNYRITDLSLEEVLEKIKKSEYGSLLKHDQLNRQLLFERVFVGYTEGDIGFKPTYKFDTGTDLYDTSEKQRIPAWCDRILFLGTICKQLVYRSHNLLKLSDHKPVSSLFEVQVKVVDETKFRRVMEEEIRKVDRRENEALPQLSISTNDIKLGTVHFMERKRFTLDVANVGQVHTGFSFVNKLEDKNVCKPWIKIEPQKGYLEMGDSMEITIHIEISKTTAGPLNSGDDTLDDILVLHLENGKDYYITLNGKYQPSCFGASIETLVRMLEPIGEMDTEIIKKMEKTDWLEESDADVSSEKFDIPKEIWMMVDYLFRHGLDTEDLFSRGGIHADLINIRDALDNGEPDNMPGSIYSIGEALMLFLESLREPVIPYAFYHKCLEASNNFTLCKQVLKKLPRSHRNVFKYLAALIRELLQHHDDNKMDQKTLAILFGELFLRAPPNEIGKESQMSTSTRRTVGQQRSRKKASFVYQFIVNEYDE